MLVKDQFKRIEWVDLFDFNIDETGKVVSGYKKDLGIEALEKYFLYDVKSDDSAEKKMMGYREEAEKPNLFQSDKLIFSHKDIKENKETPPAMLKKVTSDQVHTITSPTLSEKDKEKSDSNSAPPIAPAVSAPSTLPKEENFIEKHSRWLRGVQLLDELTDCGDSAEAIYYYVIVAMLKEINEQYQNHPEWTDVLMEEKRCLTDSMKALGRDETCSDLDRGKSELLKLWRTG